MLSSTPLAISAIGSTITQIQRLRNINLNTQSPIQVQKILEELDLEVHLRTVEIFIKDTLKSDSSLSLKVITQSVHNAIEILNQDLSEIEERLLYESSWSRWMFSWLTGTGSPTSLELLEKLQKHDIIYRKRVALLFDIAGTQT